MTEPKSSRTVKGKIISRSKGEFQDSDKSDSLNHESLLLSDEEIIDVYNQPADGLDARGFEYEMEKRRSIAKAQLAKAHIYYEYLIGDAMSFRRAEIIDIRKDERAKVLKEIGEWIDKNTGKAVPTVVGYLIEQLKLGQMPKS